MRQNFSVALFISILGLFFMTAGAQSSQIQTGLPLSSQVANENQLVQKVHGSSCKWRKRVCIDRWGYKTWRYYRCMRVGACYHGHHKPVSRCVSWKHTCKARWGYKTGRYYRCMHLHGC